MLEVLEHIPGPSSNPKQYFAPWVISSNFKVFSITYIPVTPKYVSPALTFTWNFRLSLANYLSDIIAWTFHRELRLVKVVGTALPMFSLDPNLLLSQSSRLRNQPRHPLAAEANNLGIVLIFSFLYGSMLNLSTGPVSTSFRIHS